MSLIYVLYAILAIVIAATVINVIALDARVTRLERRRPGLRGRPYYWY